MTKGIKLATLSIAILLIGVGQAGAQGSGEVAYTTRLYSDATYQTEVGQITPECTINGVQYHLTGTYTTFAVDEYYGVCGPNGWEPI